MTESTVLVTVTGPDRPGITSELTGILASGQATVLDIGQAVIHGLLSLSILFRMHPDDAKNKTTIKDLLFKATELGMKLDFQVIPSEKKFRESVVNRAFQYAVTLLAETVTAKSLHEVTRTLAAHGVNIDSIRRLSHTGFGCVELGTSTNKEITLSKLKHELLRIAKAEQVDVAIQAEGLFRRSKRLVVMDMDSTLIQNEVINEFAREHDVHSEVEAITHQAMNGNMPFSESLTLRVAKLKGLPTQSIENVYKRIKLTTGATEFIRVLKRLGYKTAVITGGFTCIADRIKDQLGIDYCYANKLELDGDRFSGKVTKPILDAQRKADLLEVIAQQEKITLDQVIAIGDGANDLLMLEKAGLGIAFNAKPSVGEKADLSLNRKNLCTILYLLGLNSKDVDEVLK